MTEEQLVNGVSQAARLINKLLKDVRGTAYEHGYLQSLVRIVSVDGNNPVVGEALLEFLRKQYPKGRGGINHEKLLMKIIQVYAALYAPPPYLGHVYRK